MNATRTRLFKVLAITVLLSLAGALPALGQSPAPGGFSLQPSSPRPGPLPAPGSLPAAPRAATTPAPPIAQPAVRPGTIPGTGAAAPGAVVRPPTGLVPPVVKGPVLRATIKPAIQKTDTRTAISFRPFTLAELKRMAPRVFTSNVTDNTVMTLPPFPARAQTTLPDRYRLGTASPVRRSRVMKAGDIVKELNAVEKKFNQQGYTLRDPRTRRIRVGRLLKNEQLLKEQEGSVVERRGRVAAPLKKFERPSVTTGLVRDLGGRTAYDPDAPTGRKGFTPLHMEDHRSFAGGDPDIFWGRLTTDYTIHGDNSVMTFDGNAKVDVAIFGQNASLLEIDADTWSVPARDRQANSKTRTTARIFGRDEVTALLPAQLNSTGTNINIPGYKKSKIVEQQVETTIEVGPVPVTLRAGVRGEVGVSTQLTLYSGSPQTWTDWPKMSASVSPFLDTWVWAEAGVGGYHVADAGVGGTLRMINDTVDLGAGLFAKTFPETPQGETFFQADLYGTNDLRMLDGSLYVYVNIDAGLDLGEYRYDLFDWKGLQFKDDLFRYPLFSYYPNKEKVLTVQVNGVTRGGEPGMCFYLNLPSFMAPTLLSRDTHFLYAQVWENGMIADPREEPHLIASQAVYNGAMANFTWSPSLTTAAELEIPVSKQTPYVVKVTLIEGTTCSYGGNSAPYPWYQIVDVSPGGKRALWLEYDGVNHRFRGLGDGSLALPDYIPRGTAVTPKLENPSSITFTLKDRMY